MRRLPAADPVFSATLASMSSCIMMFLAACHGLSCRPPPAACPTEGSCAGCVEGVHFTHRFLRLSLSPSSLRMVAGRAAHVSGCFTPHGSTGCVAGTCASMRQPSSTVRGLMPLTPPRFTPCPEIEFDLKNGFQIPLYVAYQPTAVG